MSNLPKRAHPPWCLRGADCATAPDSAAWHSSRLLRVPAADVHPCVDVAVGRWQLDPAEPAQVARKQPIGMTGTAAVLAGGVLLEFRLGDDVDQWPVDRAQALALTWLIPRLLRDDVAPRRRRAA
ncbi:hypothetical protein [Micromonospora sp. LOL_021]|uniref:hypothetical protein n=1 Tax=Micromonospora sp. LOL_021 TaxID=3345417 RepID=UPI003A867C0C